MSKFLPTRGLKWIDPKEFDLNKYTSNSSKGRNLEVDLKYPEELQELQILACSLHKKYKKSYSNNKYKISAPT